MTEHPILFSAPMVRALLDGSKTQTRRIVKPQPDFDTARKALGGDTSNAWPVVDPWNGIGLMILDNGNARKITGFVQPNQRCLYGQPGDRLWVRETSWIAPTNFTCRVNCNAVDNDGAGRLVEYPATSQSDEGAKQYGIKKTPSIFMPRWASRITLEITSVRVQRLQDISEADAIAEGIERVGGDASCSPWRNYRIGKHDEMQMHCSAPSRSYMTLWESINGPGSWDANPWVWVIQFRRLP